MAFNAFLLLKNKANQPTFTVETTNSVFKTYTGGGVIELGSFNFGVEDPVTLGGTGGGGAGKTTFDDFQFNTLLSNNTVAFLATMELGLHLDRVTLYLQRAGGTPSAKNVFAIYSFGTVFFSSVKQDGSYGDDAPTVQINMVFGQLAQHGSTQKPDGSIVPGSVAGWDRIGNKTWSEGTIDGPGF